MHINAAVERRKLAAQHLVDQCLARNHATGFAQQHLQQFKFDRSQLNWFPMMQHSTRRGVEFDITYANDLRYVLLSPLAGPAEDGADPRHELPRIKRFRKIVV